MKVITILIFSTILAQAPASQNIPKPALPPGAIIVEIEPLATELHPHRALVLWMLNPSKNPSTAQQDPDYLYTCPEEKRGSYYSESTRVSLFDTASKRLINTIEIKQEYFDRKDSFDIPYAIRKGRYYAVRSNSGNTREVNQRGIVWEGNRKYQSMNEALEALDNRIGEWKSRNVTQA